MNPMYYAYSVHTDHISRVPLDGQKVRLVGGKVVVDGNNLLKMFSGMMDDQPNDCFLCFRTIMQRLQIFAAALHQSGLGPNQVYFVFDNGRTSLETMGKYMERQLEAMIHGGGNSMPAKLPWFFMYLVSNFKDEHGEQFHTYFPKTDADNFVDNLAHHLPAIILSGDSDYMRYRIEGKTDLPKNVYKDFYIDDYNNIVLVRRYHAPKRHIPVIIRKDTLADVCSSRLENSQAPMIQTVTANAQLIGNNPDGSAHNIHLCLESLRRGLYFLLQREEKFVRECFPVMDETNRTAFYSDCWVKPDPQLGEKLPSYTPKQMEKLIKELDSKSDSRDNHTLSTVAAELWASVQCTHSSGLSFIHLFVDCYQQLMGVDLQKLDEGDQTGQCRYWCSKERCLGQ